jgi:hypothetical protein
MYISMYIPFRRTFGADLQIFERVELWWGYARMHATGTSLRLDAVSDRDGQVFDSLILEKPAEWGATWHAASGRPPKLRHEVRLIVLSAKYSIGIHRLMLYIISMYIY